jgi:hypothetical protein
LGIWQNAGIWGFLQGFEVFKKSSNTFFRVIHNETIVNTVQELVFLTLFFKVSFKEFVLFLLWTVKVTNLIDFDKDGFVVEVESNVTLWLST